MKITTEKLNEMRSVDVDTVNREKLRSIHNVRISQDLPVKERVLDYIDQIGNPYCYVDGDVVVKIRFSGKRKIENCLKAALFSDD